MKQKNITSADATLKGSRVYVQYSHDKPDISSLNRELKPLGYSFSEKNPKKKHTPLFKFSNGALSADPQKLKKIGGVSVIALSLIIAFFIFENLQLGRFVSVDATSSLPAFFLLGLIAGISSCAALIGGLLLSMIKQWNEVYIDADTGREKALPHIMFHTGRIISFVIFGGLLGLAGSAIELSNPVIFSILTIAVSLMMLVLALQMLEVQWARYFTFTSPKFLSRYATNEKNFKGKYMPFAIGSLTFFLPCGFTLIAQTIALTSGSFATGSLIMLFFAFGTLIPLLTISMTGLVFNRKPHLTARFNVVAGIVIIFFVIYNINGQLNVLGAPSLSDISFASSKTTVETGEIQTTKDGVQLLNITAEGFEYIPTSSTVLRAHTPTQLVVDNKGIQGCGAFLAARGLIDSYVPLNRGVNTIDLGSPAAGVYKLTCSMGMVAPVTIEFI